VTRRGLSWAVIAGRTTNCVMIIWRRMSIGRIYAMRYSRRPTVVLTTSDRRMNAEKRVADTSKAGVLTMTAGVIAAIQLARAAGATAAS
jgi:hypothetical protein